MLERKGARVAFVTTAGFEDTIAIGRQTRSQLYDWFAPCRYAWYPARTALRRAGTRERRRRNPPLAHRRRAEPWSNRCAPAARGRRHLAAVFLCESRDGAARGSGFGLPRNSHLHFAPHSARVSRIRARHRRPSSTRISRPGCRATCCIWSSASPRNTAAAAWTSCSLQAASSPARLRSAGAGAHRAVRARRRRDRRLPGGALGGLRAHHRIRHGRHLDRCLPRGPMRRARSCTRESHRRRRAHQRAHAGHSHRRRGRRIDCALRCAAACCAWAPNPPESEPGPICFGRGTMPTVTDANLLLGRLDPEQLSWAASVRARSRNGRADHGRNRRAHWPRAEEFAAGILRVVETQMEKAIRVISVERGHDPRQFTLVAFGGGGPLHACSLARALRIPRVLVPAMPGALSAVGILLADAVRDYSRTVMLPGDAIRTYRRHFARTGTAAASPSLPRRACRVRRSAPSICAIAGRDTS